MVIYQRLAKLFLFFVYSIHIIALANISIHWISVLRMLISFKAKLQPANLLLSCNYIHKVYQHVCQYITFAESRYLCPFVFI